MKWRLCVLPVVKAKAPTEVSALDFFSNQQEWLVFAEIITQGNFELSNLPGRAQKWVYDQAHPHPLLISGENKKKNDAPELIDQKIKASSSNTKDIVRRCLIEVPNAPRHRAERAHTEADYDEETALDNCCYPKASHRAGPGVPTNA